jgi:hypothetical protein
MTEFDVFNAPTTIPVAEAQPRERVAVCGVITALGADRWGGDATSLDVTVTDKTGSLTVSFVPRRGIAGLELGRTVIVGGPVLHRRGRQTMMNPHLWLRQPAAATAAATGAELATVSA